MQVRTTIQKMCEKCTTMHANYGPIGTRQKKWCGPCGKAEVTFSSRISPAFLPRLHREAQRAVSFLRFFCRFADELMEIDRGPCPLAAAASAATKRPPSEFTLGALRLMHFACSFLHFSLRLFSGGERLVMAHFPCAFLLVFAQSLVGNGG